MDVSLSESSDEKLRWKAITGQVGTGSDSIFRNYSFADFLPASCQFGMRDMQLQWAVERYYIARQNLFLQMQQRDPNANSFQSEDEAKSKEKLVEQLRLDFTRSAMEVKLYSAKPSIHQIIPPPDDFLVESRQVPYFTWFVKEGPTLFGVQHLFPSSMGMLYAISVNHSVLHHAILAVSTHFVDTGMKRRTSPDDHVSSILLQIQDAIAKERFDDGHIYALFLLGAMYIFRSNIDLGAKYLYGMSLMIKNAESRRRRRGCDTTKSPLIGFVLRAAVSLINRVPVEQQWMLEVDYNFLRAHEAQISLEVGKIVPILRKLQDRLATQARGPTIQQDPP